MIHSDDDSRDPIGPTRKMWTIFLFFFANLLNYTDRYLIFGILYDIQKFYNFTNSQAGLLQTVFLVSYITCSIFFGSFGDTISRKLLLLLGLLLWSMFTFIGSFIPPHLYILFYISRSLVGIGESSLSTLGFTIIGDLYVGSSRTRALSVFMLACPLGSGIGYLLGPLIVKYTNTWQWALRITPGLGIVCSVLILIFVTEPERGDAEARDLPARASLLPKTNDNDTSNTKIFVDSTMIPNVNDSILKRFYVTNIKYFYLKKSFIYTNLGYTGVTFVFGGLAIWVPKFFILVNEHYDKISGHLAGAEKIGLVFGIFTFSTGLAGVVIGGEITSNFRQKITKIELYVCIFCCIAGSVFVFFAIFTSLMNMIVTWIFVGCTLLSLSIMWTPNSDLLMFIIAPNHRSRGSAIQIFLIHTLGDALSPLIIGFISDMLKKDDSSYWNLKSLQEALYITPFFLILSALFYFLATKYYIADKNASLAEINRNTTGVLSEPIV